MPKIRILLVDDHALFREGLRRLLESEPDLEMVACCASGEEGAATLREKAVDLVLLDYDLGNEGGLEFIPRAQQDGFQGRFLIVTAGMSDADSMRAFVLGAVGIFPKHNPPGTLIEAIRKVMGGEIWLDHDSLRGLIEAKKRPDWQQQGRHFTEREDQVLQGVFEGLGNKEIGARLSISESSVKAALQQLFRKTGVRTRSQLVRIVLEERQGRRR